MEHVGIHQRVLIDEVVVCSDLVGSPEMVLTT